MSTYLKKVTQEHCGLLFQWTNDEEVRNNSFNKEKVPFKNHLKWFEAKLKCPTCHIFILYRDEAPVGQVRIDEVETNAALISYSIAKEFRGIGMASIMLTVLEDYVKKYLKSICVLIARVKYDNIPSQRIFKKLEYKETLLKDYLEYTKDLK